MKKKCIFNNQESFTTLKTTYIYKVISDKKVIFVTILLTGVGKFHERFLRPDFPNFIQCIIIMQYNYISL